MEKNEERLKNLKEQLENLKTKRERINLIVLIAILSVGMMITANIAVSISSMSLSEAVLALATLVGGSAAALTSAIALSDIYFEREISQINGNIQTTEALLKYNYDQKKSAIKSDKKIVCATEPEMSIEKSKSQAEQKTINKSNKKYTSAAKLGTSIEELTRARQKLLATQERASVQSNRVSRKLTIGRRTYYTSSTNYRRQNK